MNSNKVILNEKDISRMVLEVLNELVYVNGINGKKATLNYDNSDAKIHDDNLFKSDYVKTDKMDKNNDDTYEVPLKGGLMSYNITSILGVKVMHYFKKYFQHEKEMIDINGQDYELTMLDQEFKRFMNQFKKKIWTVISKKIEEYKKEDGFEPVGISLYPVKSSSNFNEKMVEVLSGTDLNGLPIQTINVGLFQKDLRNLERDEEFIEKNKELYGREMYVGTTTKSLSGTIDQQVTKEVQKQKHIKELQKYINIANDCLDYCVSLFNIQYKTALKVGRNTEPIIQRMANAYKIYCDGVDWVDTHLRYGANRLRGSKDVYNVLKFAKPIATEKRSKEIWELVKPYLEDKVSDVKAGKKYSYINMQPLEPAYFQIKNLVDPIRMGMKGYFSPSDDEEMFQKEVEKTKGTVFIIFDDNIGGGATLSDICMQAKEAGIEHIIPITFGSLYYLKTSAGGGNVVNGFYNNRKHQNYKF